MKIFWLPCYAHAVFGSMLGLIDPVSGYCNRISLLAGSTTCISVWLKESRQQDQKKHDPQHHIRKMVGTKSIHHHIQQQRIKWIGHLTRLQIQHPAQRAYNTRFSGRKARGRPRKTWINGVKETLSLYNIPPAQVFRRAADKRLFLPATPQVV